MSRLNTSKITCGGERVLLVANIQGDFGSLNALARHENCSALIVTGDSGIYNLASLDRIDDKTLRYWLGYSPLVSRHAQAKQILDMTRDETTLALRQFVTANPLVLSQFQQLVSGDIKLDVPVFIVPGVCEDVWLLEELRTGSLVVSNFHVIDEANSKVLDLNGTRLRLFGLPGILTPSKLFDVGEARATIAGGSGKIWTTALQMGELVELAQQLQHHHTREASEIRLLLTYSSPAREPILAQLANVLKVDYTISASMHLKYTTSYSQQAISPTYDAYRQKMLGSKHHMLDVWESVKHTVQALVSPEQNMYLQNFLAVVNRVPPKEEEPGWKLCWNWSLCDVEYGLVVLEAKDHAVRAEIKDLQGHSFENRSKKDKVVQQTPVLGNTTSVPTVPSRQVSANHDKTVSVPEPKEKDKHRRKDGQVLNSNSIGQSPHKDEEKKVDRKKKDKDQKENRDASGLKSEATKEKAETTTSPESKKRAPQFGIFMANLSLPVNNDDIKGFLGDLAADVTFIRLGRDFKTKAPKPTAIVQFSQQLSATLALQKSGTQFKGAAVDIQPYDPHRAHHTHHDAHERADDRTSWGPSPHGAFRGRGSHRGGFRSDVKHSPKVEAS